MVLSTTRPSSVTEATDALTQWMRDDALPFWIGYGFDNRSGSTYEYVAPEGLPDYSSGRRSYVQAMHMYVLSSSEHLGWHSGLQDMVKSIGDFVSRWTTSECRSDGYMRRLDHEFRIIDDHVDLSDHAFFILSSAANYRVYRKYSDQQRAKNILEWLDLKFKHAEGGWREGNYQIPYRKQSSHRRLFESFLLMYEVTRSEFWLDQAGELYELAERVFFNQDFDGVCEFFDAHWKPITPGSEKPGYKQRLSPECALEWVWLLERYERFACVKTDDISRRLWSWATKEGRDNATGLFFNEVTFAGQVQDARCTCRASAAFVKAAVSQYRRKKHGAQLVLIEALSLLCDWFLSPSSGLLYSDAVENGSPKVNRWLDAEVLFYLCCAAQEAHAAAHIHTQREKQAII